MNKKLVLLFVLCISFVYNCYSQSKLQEFDELLGKDDTLATMKFLEKWEKSDSNDAELYVSYFNYYVKQGQQEMITLGNNPKGADAFKIVGVDSNTKDIVAYIYSDKNFKPINLNKAFEYIEKGIQKHPNRLDMRFGKVYIHGQMEDYDKFSKEIIRTLDYSVENKNKWLWSENKNLDEDPKEFMLGTIQSYQIQIYNTENDSLLNYMKDIADRVLKYYPNHIESLSNLSIVYMLQKQYDKAIQVLSQAEKLNPQDYIVLANIAHAYQLNKDKANAIKYYELTVKYGDDQAKKNAQSQLDQLKR